MHASRHHFSNANVKMRLRTMVDQVYSRAHTALTVVLYLLGCIKVTGACTAGRSTLHIPCKTLQLLTVH